MGWKEVSIGEDGAISVEESALNNTLQDFCDYTLSYTSPEIYWEAKGSAILEKESA